MIKKIIKYSAISLIWLIIWQLIAMAVGQELLFPTPIAVILRLFELLLSADFYKTVAYSILRVLIGMIIGTLIGAAGGMLTAASPLARDFFAPLLAIVKSTPVASFIFLIFLWVNRDATPLIIAAMMVSPVVWTNVETGFLSTDRSLLEMAKAYKMSLAQKIRHVYLPSISPYFFSALKASLGMSWKAGIAAEALLLPLISIGKMIAESKINMETVDLFAWTVVVIVLSVIIEKLMVLLLKIALKKHSFDKIGGVSVG